VANDCAASIQACATRVSILDDDGAPLAGSTNLYVTDSLVRLTATPEVTEGEDFEVKNACGSLCVTFKDCDRLKRMGFELEICVPDPELSAMLVGGTVLSVGGAVGFAPAPVGSGCPPFVSLEVWTKRIIDGEQDATFPYWWWVFPRTTWQVAPRTFENAPMANVFTGFGTENTNWSDGPTNDWPTQSDRLFQYMPSATIPTPACGFQSLVAS